MEMINVESSNIKAVGYDKDTLYVEYKTGLYAYKEVPKSLYENLLKAESKGAYMNMFIKNAYKYEKIK